MDLTTLMLILIIALPLVMGGIFFLLELSVLRNFLLMLAAVSVSFLFSLILIYDVIQEGPVSGFDGWFYLDHLSIFNLMIMVTIYLIISIYSLGYFKDDIHGYHVTNKKLSYFYGLWLLSFASMLTVLLSNNVAIMWVGIEATTLLTTFLICFHKTKTSLEAMWKYILICSVGVALSFIGIIFVSMAISDPVGNQALMWTYLWDHATQLNPGFMKIGFIFMVVGYGTKAGLAPMHNWLPDAHGQAPGPVSAMFSGLMLNVALYCLTRYIPLLHLSTGSDWSDAILRLIGLVSIVVAAIFISFQRDLKRLFAYSSVEHMGIIALALGLGKAGSYVALFHALNHSVAKTLAFLSAGRIVQQFKGQQISDIGAVMKISPLWGTGIVFAVLALVGMAPFSIFMSKFLVAKVALGEQYWTPLIIFLLGTATVFIVLMKNVIKMSWSLPKGEYLPPTNFKADYVIVYFLIALCLVLGIWMPDCLSDLLTKAAAVVNGGQ